MEQNQRLASIREQWNRRAATFPTTLRQEGLDLMDFLEGVVRFDGAKMLDVGCGTGRYLAEFLRRGGGHATGLEIAENMIAEGERLFREEGFKPEQYRFIHQPWEEMNLKSAGLIGAFDLVLAVNTPAIGSEESLQKMVDATRNTLAIMAFIDRKDLFFNEIYKAYHGEEKNFKSQCPDCLKDFFAKRGLTARYEELEVIRPGKDTVDGVLNRYADWLYGRENTAEQRAELRDILVRESEDGETIRYKFWSRSARLIYSKK